MKEISPLRYKLQQFRRKLPYIWLPLLVVASYLLFYFFAQPSIEGLHDSIHQKLGTLISVIMSMAGILLTVLTIVLALNKENSFAAKFFKSEHFNIYIITVVCGITAALIGLVFYLFSELQVVIISLSLVTLSEFMVLLYYIFFLFKQYAAGERNGSK